MPVEADPHIHPADHHAASTTVHNNFGVVFHASAEGAQVATNNSGQINQQQTHGDQLAPWFEPLAQTVALVMQGLALVKLTDDDRRDAEEAAAEVTTDHPNSSKIRRAVNVLKGVLAPIGAGLATATNAEVQEWARTAIDQLGAALYLRGPYEGWFRASASTHVHIAEFTQSSDEACHSRADQRPLAPCGSVLSDTPRPWSASCQTSSQGIRCAGDDPNDPGWVGHKLLP
ncbi:hypothetical protein [Winogradskya humida]|uniref:Uncharacterized protein n=1 Tax=Winogradskya humida TaxID=113566 RepID=A0ABQ4A636_9ACTN|nr:hypothetical protein [Actinoplanes humidus]GIE26321.1 hypothetical protein Ahu01nite_094230 [Actinoplanes humidus]